MRDDPNCSGLERLQQLCRKRIAGCEVTALCLSEAAAVIRCPGNQQDLEAGVCGVAVKATGLDIDLRVCLNINEDVFQGVFASVPCVLIFMLVSIDVMVVG